MSRRVHKDPRIAYAFAWLAALVAAPLPAWAGIATTTVTITICGDAIVQSNEVCDDGSNVGGYGSSIAARACLPGCQSYGPYCGDGILQPIQNEECDDGNNTNSDRCASNCRIENLPETPAVINPTYPYPDGTTTPLPVTKVILQGRAYPLAEVRIMKDGVETSRIKADSQGAFSFEQSGITPGVTTYGFWTTDSKGRRSVTFTTTLTVVANAATTISGAYLPPTLELDKAAITSGERVIASGQALPSSTIAVYADSDGAPLATIAADSQGAWSGPLATGQLENKTTYAVRALYRIQGEADGPTITTGYSQPVNLAVGIGSPANQAASDVNGDNKVNLVDFSILLFHWGGSGPEGDLNRDGTVDITDFSILLFHWTG